MTEPSHQKVSESLGRWTLVVWSVLSVVALLVHLRPAIHGWRQPAVHVDRGVGVLAGVVQQVLQRVPADSAILVDTWQAPRVPADQYLERELAYWVFPRRVYSADAVRGSQRTLEEFVRTRGIRWGVRGLDLVPIDSSTIDEEFAAGPLPEPEAEPGAVARGMTLFGPLQRPGVWDWLLVLVALMVGLAGGRGVLRLLRVDREMPLWVERWGWSWFIGLSITAVSAMGLFFSGRPVTPWLPLVFTGLFGLAGGAAFLARRDSDRELTGDQGVVAVPVIGGMSQLLVVALALGMVLAAVARGIDGFDQRMQWAYKARLMQTEAGPWGDSVFQDNDHVHFHPRYPLLVPAAEAVWGGVGLHETSGGGGFSESSAVLVFPLTWLAMAGIVVGALHRLGGRDPVRGGLLMLALPAWSGLGLAETNLAAFNGCPELVVGAALLAAVLAALAAQEKGGGWWILTGLCLVVAGLAKAEGSVAVAVVVGIALASAVAHRDFRALRRSVAVALSVGVVLLAHEVVFTRGVVAGILPDDYRKLLTVEVALEGMSRVPDIVSKILVDVIRPTFGAIGVLVLVAIACSRGGWRCPAAGWPLAICVVMLPAFCVPFLVIPSYLDNLDWAAGRLVSEIIPLAVWALVVILDPCHRSHRSRSDSVNSLAGDGSGVGSE